MTVVEWGEGIAEGLAESRLEIRDHPGAGPRGRARRPRPAPGADDAGRAALVRAGAPRHPAPAAGSEAGRDPAGRLPALRGATSSRTSTREVPLTLSILVPEHRRPGAAGPQRAAPPSGSCRWRGRGPASRPRDGGRRNIPHDHGRRPRRPVVARGVATVQYGPPAPDRAGRRLPRPRCPSAGAFAGDGDVDGLDLVGPDRRTTRALRDRRPPGRVLRGLLLACRRPACTGRHTATSLTPCCSPSTPPPPTVTRRAPRRRPTSWPSSASEQPMRHGEQLAPLIDRALPSAGLVRQDLTAIAVGVGPGPSPGCGSAWSPPGRSAFVLDIPVYGVCSLDVLAVEAVDTGAVIGDFVVATDARRKEVYLATYDEDGQRLDRPGRRPAGRPRDRRAGRGRGCAALSRALPDPDRPARARVPAGSRGRWPRSGPSSATPSRCTCAGPTRSCPGRANRPRDRVVTRAASRS